MLCWQSEECGKVWGFVCFSGHPTSMCLKMCSMECCGDFFCVELCRRRRWGLVIPNRTGPLNPRDLRKCWFTIQHRVNRSILAGTTNQMEAYCVSFSLLCSMQELHFVYFICWYGWIGKWVRCLAVEPEASSSIPCFSSSENNKRVWLWASGKVPETSKKKWTVNHCWIFDT